MTKSKFAIILDGLLISIVAFILSFIWIYRLIKNAFLCNLICIFISICLFIAYYLWQIKIYKLNKLKSSELSFANFCYTNIINLSDNFLSNFYSRLTNSNQIKDNIYKNNSSIFFINLKKQLTSDDFLLASSYYLETKNTLPLTFLGNGYSEDFIKIAESSSINFIIFDKTEIFLLMKNKNLFPVENKNQEISKKHFNLKLLKIKLASVLTKNRFKDFFFSGLSLVTFSIFIPYSFYYMLFGSILLIFSIICLFSKTKKTENNIKPTLESLTKKDA